MCCGHLVINYNLPFGTNKFYFLIPTWSTDGMQILCEQLTFQCFIYALCISCYCVYRIVNIYGQSIVRCKTLFYQFALVFQFYDPLRTHILNFIVIAIFWFDVIYWFLLKQFYFHLLTLWRCNFISTVPLHKITNNDRASQNAQ